MVRKLSLISALAILGAASGCGPKPLTADDMPRPLAGLWRYVGVDDGIASKGDICLSGRPVHITDASSNCEKIAWSRGADGAFEIDASCSDHDLHGDIKARYSGDFHSSYVMDGSNAEARPGPPVPVVRSHFAFQFAGPCPAGRAPEDLK
ncbi:MAG TPA: hypothetical protein VN814_00690 [Caulobacteraceae bacterium]|nr:hypothetical protein [Caulobacteraceae bacterium]